MCAQGDRRAGLDAAVPRLDTSAVFRARSHGCVGERVSALDMRVRAQGTRVRRPQMIAGGQAIRGSKLGIFVAAPDTRRSRTEADEGQSQDQSASIGTLEPGWAASQLCRVHNAATPMLTQWRSVLPEIRG